MPRLDYASSSGTRQWSSSERLSVSQFRQERFGFNCETFWDVVGGTGVIEIKAVTLHEVQLFYRAAKLWYEREERTKRRE